jgi:DNA-binding CsgD family transcriptional regulator
MLVERERELRALDALVAAARAGEGGAAVVVGPAGIGKTALLDAAAERARGFRVLRGRCGELERELSFGLVRDLLVPALRSAADDDRARWLAGAASGAAGVLEDAPAGLGDPAAVLYGLYWLLAAIADDGPVLVIADDVHWSDSASGRWLAHLARRLDALPVTLLAASRPPRADDVGLHALLAADGLAVLRPAPLSREATGALVARRLGLEPTPGFVDACDAAAEGNPWLLGELLDACREAGRSDAEAVATLAGERLRAAVPIRVGRLGPAALRLARATAVLGDGCELSRATALAELDEPAAADAVAALVAAGTLEDRPALVFRHPLVRAAVYADVPAAVRAALHARAAELLADAGAEAESVAGQLLASSPVGRPWAVAALRGAAATALARGAPESTVAFLRRALHEPLDTASRAELLGALGNALARLGDPDAAAVLEQALALEPGRIRMVEDSADTLFGYGHPHEARRILVTALARPHDPDVVLRLSARLATIRAQHGPGDGDRHVDALRERAGDLDPSSFAGRYAAAALALLGVYCDGSAEEIRRLAWLAVGDADRHLEDARGGRPLHGALIALAFAGDPKLALRRVDTAIAVARSRGSLMGQGLGLALRSLVHGVAGHVADAENDARAARAIVAETGLRESERAAIASVAWALAERAEVDEALALLDGAPPRAGLLGAALGCARARVLLGAHRAREALSGLTTVAGEAQRAGWRSSGPLPWRALLAATHLALGDRAAARSLAARELAEARRFGSAREVGRALRLVALVNEDPEARREAIRLLRAAQAPLELAYALADDGAALRRGGERAASRAPLREALELAHECGATALVERTRVELRAAGARPRSERRSGVEALTPSERRVADLAAGGLSNREIAQALFVTVRTVEMHLSAAYRKLDVSSRAALPAALE